MAKKDLNERCPLQGECERKCEYKFNELECEYYANNGVGEDRTIPDQEEKRGEIERRRYEESYEADLAELEDDPAEDEENPGTGGLVYIPIRELFQHPDNPRKDLGDLTELADSIKANGILQNLTVVPNMVVGEISGDSWQRGYKVIIGHRRLAAAKLAGLTELPCIIREMTVQEQVKTMLMENIQRSDLTVYEQAQGFQLMLDMGETIESIAKDSGFSQTTVRRRVKLLDLDAEKFRKSGARGATLQDYMELDKIEDPELKNKALDAIGTVNFRNELKSAIEADKLKKRMAAWRADLETFATEIEKRDYIGEEYVPMDYVRNYGRWHNDSVTVERPEDADTVRYYFRASSDQLDLYRDHQEIKETEEDRLRKKAREEQERREAELDEITERHFALRSEFVSEFGRAKKCLREICRYASNMLIGDGGWGRNEINAELLGTLLDLDIDDHTDYGDLKAMVAVAAKDSPEYVLLACAYASEDDEGNRYFKRVWNSKKSACDFEYDPNDGLDSLYDFLISLGYEMSDEEKAMQNGSHELLQSDEEVKEDPCALCKSSHPACDKCCQTCTEHCNAWQDCRRA